MTLAPSPYSEYSDLRPVIVSKGLKTFHLATADDDDNLLDDAACGANLDKRATLAGTMTKRGALRRGLKLCPACEALELDELTGLEEEPTE